MLIFSKEESLSGMMHIAPFWSVKTVAFSATTADPVWLICNFFSPIQIFSDKIYSKHGAWYEVNTFAPGNCQERHCDNRLYEKKVSMCVYQCLDWWIKWQGLYGVSAR